MPPLLNPELWSLQYDAVGEAVASIAQLFPQHQEEVAADKRQGHLGRRDDQRFWNARDSSTIYTIIDYNILYHTVLY